MATMNVNFEIAGLDELTRHIEEINRNGLSCPKCGHVMLPSQKEKGAMSEETRKGSASEEDEGVRADEER